MTDVTSAPPNLPLTDPLSTPSASPALAPGKRRRRPSGEPPPLPRELGRTGRHWAWLMAAVLALWGLVLGFGLGPQFDRVDHWILRRVVAVRNDGLTDVAKHLQWLGSHQMMVLARWLALPVALAFKRFRHALVFIGSLLVTATVTEGVAVVSHRPRPWGVEILGSWNGYAHPSRVMAGVALTLLGITYMLVPRGPWRQIAKGFTAGYLAVLFVCRMYLAVENPSDAIFGVILGVGVSLVAFRVFAPTDVFPVTYRRAKGAHLDVGGRRGEAIKQALREQLGLDVVSVEPFGLDGSAGSTPLRITLAGDGGTVLFGKLYAKNHLRSDRWYKLFRTLVYGRLEDESTFSTVRRLIQYEDYLLRLMYGAGIPTAQPYGFVEITPEREYLLVTEFLEGAKEIGKAEVDEAVIDDAVDVVRLLWDAGLAHRDVKPANVLVRDGNVLLIDVAFAEVRPSPWRQAVDLANMLLVLALRSDPTTVYRRAVLKFTPDEVAEAFAATRGITLTSQLRSRLRQDGRDLIGTFRQLAPERRPIKIQIWSLRRVGLTVAVLLAVIFGFQVAIGLLSGSTLL